MRYNETMLRLLSFFLVGALSVSSALSAAATKPEASDPELVYSYPVETSLSEPDLRRANEVWPKMIDTAKRTIDIEQFYIVEKKGGLLDPTLAALRRAIKRGVKVRFIMEKLFFKIDPNSLPSFEELKAMGIDARAIQWSEINGAGIIHAKFFVVDGKRAFIGSQNFDWRSLEHIHEMGIRTSDPGVVAGAQAIFNHDWELTTSSGIAKSDNAERPQADRSKPIYLVASPWRLNPPGVGDSESELAHLIGEARTEVAIQLLDYNAQTRSKPPRYYGPIDTALRDAALRGVKVKLLVSHWNTDSHDLPHIKSLAMLPNVEVRIITMPDPPSWKEHVPFTRTAHSKYMVVDGKTLWLGTSNWAGGYLDDARNLELVIHDEKLAARAAKVHQHLWDSPYTSPLDVTKAYGEPRR